MLVFFAIRFFIHNHEFKLNISHFYPKIFRVNYVDYNSLSIVKLNEKKIQWIIAQKEGRHSSNG